MFLCDDFVILRDDWTKWLEVEVFGFLMPKM